MKSLRGKLIEDITKHYLQNQAFDYVVELQRNLQNFLNSNLTFETKVSVITVNKSSVCEDMTSGNIYFKDENNIESSISFTVLTHRTINVRMNN